MCGPPAGELEELVVADGLRRLLLLELSFMCVTMIRMITNCDQHNSSTSNTNHNNDNSNTSKPPSPPLVVVYVCIIS